ncbi:MAG TPA: ABC transporter permease [Firmicutes bacterium]|nr:ABC transporter permease [Bacillota bacterium]
MKSQAAAKNGALSKAFGEERRGRRGSSALYRKELADHLRSRRFYIILALLLFTTTASLIGAASTLASSETDSSEFMFLSLFTTSSSSIYSIATFIAFLGPLVGITLGFDAISNERSQGTLNRLAAQPIYRDSIINAKFLSGATAVFVVMAVVGLYISGLGLALTGLEPSAEEAFRVVIFFLFSGVYISVWLALAIIFSVVCRHAATAALACISIWLFLSMFMSLVASGIANWIYPLEGMQIYTNQVSNYELQLGLNRISPYYLFSEAASTILNPGVRSIGVVTLSQYEGAVASSLSLGQSLLLIWPHLVGMIAIAMAGFAISYICFMRQEIRA